MAKRHSGKGGEFSEGRCACEREFGVCMRVCVCGRRGTLEQAGGVVTYKYYGGVE